MSDFLPPPTHIEPFTLDEATGRWMFSPIWMQWFIDVTAFITSSGGGGGGAADHESLTGLLGGAVGQHYHTDNTQYTELVGNKAAHLVYAGPTAGGATTPAFRALTPGDIPTGAIVAFGLDGEDGELGDQGVPGPVGPAGQNVMGPPGLDGENADMESLGFGVTGVFVTGANGIGVSGSPITSSGTIALSLGAITPTSVSTPSIITASGALGITPAAGSNLNVTLGTTGDFAVNADQLYVDTSSGYVGVGTDAPSDLVSIVGQNARLDLWDKNAAGNSRFAFTCYGGASPSVTLQGRNAAPLYIGTNSGIDFGITPEHNCMFWDGTTPYNLPIGNYNKVHIGGNNIAHSSLGVSYWSADALGSRIELGKSRGAAIGTNTIVQDGDVVGSLLGYGANGSTFTNLASIGMEVDGTPGATNDMPGRIVFKTTPNGSGTLTEAMRLSQDQTALFAANVTVPGLTITGSTVPANGIYLPSANTVGFSANSALQATIVGTASASRYVTLAGSNGGNPTIATSAGDLAITPNVVGAGSFTSGAPTTGTAAPWKFGTLVTGQVGLVMLTTQYLEVDVSGALVKLATI